jgi:DNA repair photolyase
MEKTIERGIVEVAIVTRESAVLTPSSLACLARIPTINLTAGCAHGCLYCYTTGYSSYPGDGKVKVYSNTFSKLQLELPRKRKRPQAVYFSPSSDVFQPVPEVQEMSYKIFSYLLSMGIGIAFLTKGVIPRKHMELFKAHPDQVRAQVGLITLDDQILGMFEPRASRARERLSEIAELTKAGIKTQVRLDPILPGLTNDEHTLQTLLKAIAETGVKQIAASMLFLRPEIAKSLRGKIVDPHIRENLLSSFSKSGIIRIHAEHSKVRALSITERDAVFSKLEAIAKVYGIEVKICACKNPDLASNSCSIAGEWIKEAKSSMQPNLFKN